MRNAGRMMAALLAVGVGLFAGGCATTPGGIAPSNVPLEGKTYTELGHTAGKDSLVRLFCILPVSGSNSIRQAMERAIRNKNGDALINITVEAYSSYWILFSKHVTRVEGTAIRFTK
jgi:hypothetical protein